MTPTPSIKPVPAHTAADATASQPGWIERHLVLLLAFAVGVGVGIAHFIPGVMRSIVDMRVGAISLPIAALIWAAVIPAMMQASLPSNARLTFDWRGASIALFVGGIIRPISMALLAAIALAWLFRPLLPAAEIPAYIAGLTLLAAGPPSLLTCLWVNLAGADQRAALLQILLAAGVALIAAGPAAALLLDLPIVLAPPSGMLIAVTVHVVVPVAIAQLLGRRLAAQGDHAVRVFTASLRPWTLGAVLLLLAILSGMAAPALIQHPLVIALLAFPLACQVYLNAGQAMLMSRLAELPHARAVPAALIGASGSGIVAAALAADATGTGSATAAIAAVGLLAEIPLGLSVVLALDACRRRYESAAG